MNPTMELGAARSVAAPTAWRSRREQWFFTGMAVFAAAIVLAGFAPTYFLRSVSGQPALSPLLHVHGFLFTSWILLFVAQTTLVAAHRTDLHRRLGVAGGTLAVLMLIVGLMVAIGAARRGFTPPGGPPPLAFMAIPLGDLAVFATLVFAGLSFRRRREIHRRLMLFATIGLLTPAIARLPGVLAGGPPAFFGITDLVVIGVLLYDRYAHGRVHPASWWGSLTVVLSQPLRLAVSGTGAWLAFAQWLAR